MKARYAYPLLFLLPAAIAAAVVAVVGVAGGAGVLWVFVHGDALWPRSAEVLLKGLAIALFALVLLALLRRCHATGKLREAEGGVRGRDAALAFGLTGALVVLVLLQQWSVGWL